MLRHTLRAFGPALGLTVLASLAGTAWAENELSDKDKRWMEEEVGALITQQETTIFKDINKDDRNLFKEIFWLRRDPNPSTKDNEFKKEYDARLKSVDKDFKSGAMKGSATDQGRIYLLLGQPNRKEQTSGGETWHYDPNPKMGLQQGISIQFQANSLVKSDELTRALELAKTRLVTNPFAMYARDTSGRLFKPRTDFDLNTPAMKILTALRETKAPSADIPFQTMEAFFRASEGQIYVPVLLEIDSTPLTWQGEQADATVFGAVENADGAVIYQFEEDAKLSKSSDGRTMFEMPIQLQPGPHSLFIGVLDDKSGTAGTKIVPLDVPDFFTGDLVMSSVVCYNEGREVTESAGTPGHAFQFGPVKFRPTNQFKQQDTIGFFFFVYGSGVDANGTPSITGQYIFFKDGERKGQTKEGPLQGDARQAVGNAEIPLATFEPGNWKMQVKVTDQIQKKTLTKDVEFVLEGASQSNDP